MIVPVILSGGSGTRMWPLSRRLQPKQLVPTTGPHTMLQATAARLDGFAGVAPPIVACNEAHLDLVLAQLDEISHRPAAVILEPVGRSTAPAAAAAALEAERSGDDPVLLILPADHVIEDLAAFRAAVEAGLPLAEAGRLVTFGIVPHYAETGYGYIKRGSPVRESGAFAIERFVEKPDATTAAAYLASGDFLWNSGMFLFRSSRYLSELNAHRPDILDATRAAYERAGRGGGRVSLDPETFAGVPGESIDYAVMEPTADGVVIPLEAGWNDVGSWAALWTMGEADENGNVVAGDVVIEHVRDSYVRSTGRLVAVIGLDDVVVVETADAVLVCSRSHAQDVKTIVERLTAAGRPEAERHVEGTQP